MLAPIPAAGLLIPFQGQAAEGRSEAAGADQLNELSGYEMPPVRFLVRNPLRKPTLLR